jgi:serine/threonine-protein kinase
MATGQLPFQAEHVVGILNKHQFSPHPPASKVNPNIDPKLERIINKALEKEAPDRQQSMRQLRAELRELLDPSLGSGGYAPASVRGMQAVSPEEITGAYPKYQETPEWLERGGGYPEGRTPPQARAVPSGAAGATASDTGDLLAPKALAFLQRLVSTKEPTQFAQGAQQLEAPLRTLAARGDVDTLWQVASTMHGISTEGNGAVGSRAWSAAKLLRVFEDPALLTHVAEHYLAGRMDDREKARRVLVTGGVAGAYGLYGARVKHASNAAVRQPFVTLLKDFGPKAWPVVRASLEKIAATPGPNPATFDLAEDLLLCVPVVGDENAGHTVLKFLRWTHSGVCRGATAAIVKLWGDRAKPVLVAMIQSKDDVIRIAGIAGLRQLGAIDEHVVPRLQGILTRRVPAGDEVRGAAAVALSHAAPGARKPAIEILKNLLQPRREEQPSSSKQDAIILAMARSLLTLGGSSQRNVIEQRAAISQEPLKGQLRQLLAQSA